MKKTPLYDEHVRLGARMMPFAGYDMPVQYSSILAEHLAVRRAAGLFDVSHMGEIRATGPAALAFVQGLITNDAAKLTDGRALYTVMCNPDGGVVDDLLVYRLGAEDYLLVVNASTAASDFAWMQAHNDAGAELADQSEATALLAVQGPAAFEIVQQIVGEPITDIAYYHFKALAPGGFFGSRFALISHTGYTGEPGVEIYCDADKAAEVWQAVLEAGRPHGLLPAGLGARDSLRLEAGYPLYGAELDAATTPLEAGLGWVVKLAKEDFVGRDALRTAKDAGVGRKLVGFVMQERAVPRHGFEVVDPDEGETIGVVTSGGHSPLLEKGIGLAYAPNQPRYTEEGASLGIRIRDRVLPARVVRPPFHKK